MLNFASPFSFVTLLSDEIVMNFLPALLIVAVTSSPSTRHPSPPVKVIVTLVPFFALSLIFFLVDSFIESGTHSPEGVGVSVNVTVGAGDGIGGGVGNGGGVGTGGVIPGVGVAVPPPPPPPPPPPLPLLDDELLLATGQSVHVMVLVVESIFD